MRVLTDRQKGQADEVMGRSLETDTPSDTLPPWTVAYIPVVSFSASVLAVSLDSNIPVVSYLTRRKPYFGPQFFNFQSMTLPCP